MLNEAHLRDLLEKAVAGKASGEELGVLADALKSDADFEVIDQIAAFLNNRNAVAYTLPTEERMSRLVDEILEADKLSPMSVMPPSPRAPVVALWKKIAVAAVLIVAATAALYLWQTNKQPAEVVAGNEENKYVDVNPGNNKARLTLADGSIVVLDTMAIGALSVQGQVRISKCNDGQVSYEAVEAAPKENNSVASSLPLFNMITVPRGGQYKLILADGTQVWLNAASSLRFPVTFTGTERIVELEGEGYFEVAKDAAKPFYVRTKQADVRVLGTHFNVCAYPEEDWKTTLLEGSVKVVNRQSSSDSYQDANVQQQSAILKPGQQAVISSTSSKSNQSLSILVQTADIDEAIAWKEGYFQFNDASVPFIMQQVSRWYDVDIVYKDMADKARFNGRINRTIKLSGIVNALKQGGINCAIEQNRLVVYP